MSNINEIQFWPTVHVETLPTCYQRRELEITENKQLNLISKDWRENNFNI